MGFGAKGNLKISYNLYGFLPKNSLLCTIISSFFIYVIKKGRGIRPIEALATLFSETKIIKMKVLNSTALSDR